MCVCVCVCVCVCGEGGREGGSWIKSALEKVKGGDCVKYDQNVGAKISYLFSSQKTKQNYYDK